MGSPHVLQPVDGVSWVDGDLLTGTIGDLLTGIDGVGGIAGDGFGGASDFRFSGETDIERRNFLNSTDCF